MAFFYNGNDAYGDCGPFEAPSKDYLADGMMDTFREWASKNVARLLDEGEEFDEGATPEADMVTQMRSEFINGLEEVKNPHAVSLGHKGGSVKSARKAKSSAENGKKGGRPSGKLIAKWSDDINVGIWDNEVWTLRLYRDRAILKYPTVNWRGDIGSLAYVIIRKTGHIHAELLALAAEQVEDNADYTERVRGLIWDEMYSGHDIV